MHFAELLGQIAKEPFLIGLEVEELILMPLEPPPESLLRTLIATPGRSVL
jgi:hypothetical protein